MSRKKSPTRKSKKSKKTREKLSTGQCEICDIKTSTPERTGYQPWHLEQLEHVLDHELGGKISEPGQIAIICQSCNSSLEQIKTEIMPAHARIVDENKKMKLFDYFIFKQILLTSHIAAARDFGDDYRDFQEKKRKLANASHSKMLGDLKDGEERGAYHETVYWTIDCFGHQHCWYCGACHCTRLSHSNGHNVAYISNKLKKPSATSPK